MRTRRGIATVATGLLAATTGIAMGGPTPALAETTTFATPGEHQYTVPAGVTRIRVIAMGANGLFAGAGFGVGAVAQADIPVTPGSTLYAIVGGNGGQSHAGFNGGGGTINAGGGGGATDLRPCTIEPGGPNTCDPADLGSAVDPRLIVAGGGGGTSRVAGSAAASNVGSPGGTPNAAPGGNGFGADRGFGGQGGTQAAGGAGGIGPLPGEAGTAGQGGMGGSSAAGGDGGGGGGGYFGGGGGGGTQTVGSGGGGGAGGSSYAVDGSLNVSYRQKSATEVSSITIITPIPQAVAFTSTPADPAVYGSVYQATATGGDSGQPIVFTVDPASTPGACSVSTEGGVAFTGVGTCVVNADQAGDNNYEAAHAQQSITVTAAPLVVNAPNPTRVYGADNPALTPTYTGFVAGDDETSLTVPATCSTTATTASDVGTYPVTCAGAASPNYTISYSDGSLTVTAASLVVNAPNATRLYGAEVPALTPTYAGFVAGDDETSLGSPATCTTTAIAASDVGTYPVTCAGAASPNYTISYSDGTLTVTAASLVVNAPNPARVYGADNPALTPTYTGFVAGDDETSLTVPATCSTTATTGSDVGPYPVTCAGAANSNYTISYSDGTLTITPAPTTLTVSPLLSTLLQPTATLVRSDTGAPVAGQSVTFSVSGAQICRATTSVSGVARCSTIVVSLRLDGVFGGSQNYSASNVAHGGLL
jgi:MBG domain-containing protein/glycine rich protein